MVLFEFLTTYIVNIIASVGYAGIFLLMAIESACTPLPSEIVMPFSGFAAQRGELNFWLVVLAGSLGCLAGSMIAYTVGYYGGRPFLEKYGRYVFIKKHDIDLADRWFKKYGGKAVFLARLLPIVRAFISLPAGIARMDVKRFALYSFVGSVPWCLTLAYVGVLLGDNWEKLEGYWVYFDVLTVVGIVAVVAYFAYKIFIKKDKIESAINVDE